MFNLLKGDQNCLKQANVRTNGNSFKDTAPARGDKI